MIPDNIRPCSASPIPGIEKTPGVCGGDARVAGSRLTVWVLAQMRDLGMSDGAILANYPTLSPDGLRAAWAYTAAHRGEIADAIRANEEA